MKTPVEHGHNGYPTQVVGKDFIAYSMTPPKGEPYTEIQYTGDDINYTMLSEQDYINHPRSCVLKKHIRSVNYIHTKAHRTRMAMATDWDWHYENTTERNHVTGSLYIALHQYVLSECSKVIPNVGGYIHHTESTVPDTVHPFSREEVLVDKVITYMGLRRDNKFDTADTLRIELLEDWRCKLHVQSDTSIIYQDMRKTR